MNRISVPRTLFVDGYAVSLTVERGHLLAVGGTADDRVERRIYRSDQDINRILVNSMHGTLSLSALRWCADVGIAVVVLDPVAQELLSITPSRSHNDARLRRSQAVAAGQEVGLSITTTLLDAKLRGQVRVAREGFGDLNAADRIEAARAGLAELDNVQQALLIEANAASDYFAAWEGEPIRFVKRDLAKVPPTWTRFTRRTSPLTAGHSPRQAADPINALLNYSYTLAAAEATLACHTLGLDPGHGFLHADKPGRDSLAWDLIEAVRPDVDAYVLDLVRNSTFTRDDFTETRDGRCVLLAPIAEGLAHAMPAWAASIAPVAEQVAHQLAEAAEGQLRIRRPLTGRSRRTGVSVPPAALKTARPSPKCPQCGGALGDRRRHLCPECSDVNRLEVAHKRVAAQRSLISDLETSKVTGERHRRELGAARSSLNRLLADLWELENPDGNRDPAYFRSCVLPGLEVVPVASIREALAVGNDAAWRIRNGTLTPHPRHWQTLKSLTDRRP